MGKKLKTYFHTFHFKLQLIISNNFWFDFTFFFRGKLYQLNIVSIGSSYKAVVELKQTRQQLLRLRSHTTGHLNRKIEAVITTSLHMPL